MCCDYGHRCCIKESSPNLNLSTAKSNKPDKRKPLIQVKRQKQTLASNSKRRKTSLAKLMKRKRPPLAPGNKPKRRKNSRPKRKRPRPRNNPKSRPKSTVTSRLRPKTKNKPRLMTTIRPKPKTKNIFKTEVKPDTRPKPKPEIPSELPKCPDEKNITDIISIGMINLTTVVTHKMPNIMMSQLKPTDKTKSKTTNKPKLKPTKTPKSKLTDKPKPLISEPIDLPLCPNDSRLADIGIQIGLTCRQESFNADSKTELKTDIFHEKTTEIPKLPKCPNNSEDSNSEVPCQNKISSNFFNVESTTTLTYLLSVFEP